MILDRCVDLDKSLAERLIYELNNTEALSNNLGGVSFTKIDALSCRASSLTDFNVSYQKANKKAE
jgi:hypothetical protein